MQTILFDLDGTLLPMEQEPFTKAYFAELCKTCAPYGYEAGQLVKTIWAGTKAMIQNDGSVPNAARFWDVFAAQYGEESRRMEPVLDEFYRTAFHNAKRATQPTPLAGPCVRALRDKGYTLALASNPLFPDCGMRSRMAWAGVDPADFAHITGYENSSFCKPNPAYFREIAQKLGVRPADCLMVGNNPVEDMQAARDAGMETYFITDCPEGYAGAEDLSQWRQSSFAAFAEFAQALPNR